MQEDDRGAVGADAGLAGAEDGHALGAHLSDGVVDVGHLEADVVLAALGVLGQEAGDGAGLVIGLDQFDLGRRRVDEADLHPLGRQVERLADLRRTQDVAIQLDRVRDRGRGDADVVQGANHHFVSAGAGWA
ncbi:hypothetical protein D3C85_1374250 [compost metagenome]